MSGSLHTRKTFLNHNTPKLIFIRVGRDHKSGKALPQNTIAFSELELDSTWFRPVFKISRNINDISLIFQVSVHPDMISANDSQLGEKSNNIADISIRH